MGRYDDKKDNFRDSGPTHLTPTEIDWDNDEHRRCITASLVKGTYVLESDRSKRREDTPEALATAWWETFNFRKLPEYTLERDCKCPFCEMRHKLFGYKRFVYGVVFEYTPPTDGTARHPSAPSYIVAFRGTMTGDPIVLNDMLQNFRIMINKQHICSRFVHARENVRRLVLSQKQTDRGEIWLAGHSLGASIALDVGRDMVTTPAGGRCCNPPTFLFNPPNVSAAPLLDGVMSEQAKRHLFISSYVLKCVLAETILRPHKEHMEELFQQLSGWMPSLFLHPRDPICKSFIDYFEQREQVKQWSTRVANSATTMSYRDMLFHRHSERPQLLPSAVMWTNSHGDDPHGLQQWWQRELDLRPIECSWSLT